jgi:uncharacterized protein (TIGR03084 family)
MDQVQDFLSESRILNGVLESLPEADWSRPTGFKAWTVTEIVRHLHVWNRAADLAATEPGAFRPWIADLFARVGPDSLRPIEVQEVPQSGRALLSLWRDFVEDMGVRWTGFDPRMRIAWVGPDMSVRSAITARQMETWAHGQAIFDLLGQERAESDRIRNIVVLGVNTFGWSHKVHGRAVPEMMPSLELVAPSGALWTFGEASEVERITGTAVDFARVVTQTRNLADTGLSVTGPVAQGWMACAQCFAGPPETPPAPGTRGPRRAA